MRSVNSQLKYTCFHDLIVSPILLDIKFALRKEKGDFLARTVVERVFFIIGGA
jgi:hypothetical protein